MIADGTLKFTCPLEFNDPFDSMPAYDPNSIKNVTKLRPDLIRKAGKNLGLSPAKRIQKNWWFQKNVEAGINSGDYAKAIIGGLGIFCVSRTPCNPLMWAHYADSHKGFTVELRIAMDAPGTHIQTILPCPVEYTKTRPIINWAHSVERDLEKYFFTKSEDWSYEQEERTITPGAGIYAYSRAHFLCSVIAGARISEPDYETLKAVVGKASRELGKEVPLHKAQLAQHSYRVFIPGLQNPDFAHE